MSALSPTSLKQLCTTYDLVPSKKYGQNYLISDAPIRKMIDAAKLDENSHVYEIGPGFGILTFALLETGASVHAFEIEKKLQPYWEQYVSVYQNLKMTWGNALYLWEGMVQKETGAYTVVANLPYQITSHAFEVILTSSHPPERIVCMVQREVAERIVTRPGDMSVLAVSIQYYGTPRIVARVPRGSFWPMPQVDSAILLIDSITPREASTSFFSLVKQGFSHKRKKLIRNIRGFHNHTDKELDTVFAQMNMSTDIRAEQLSIPEWEKLLELLTR